MSKALTRLPQLDPGLRLAQAISEFEADLPEVEKSQFKAQRQQRPQPVDVMRLTAEIDRSMSRKGIKRGYGPRLTSFLEGVQRYASIGDVLVGGSQYLPACAVWTLVRFSLTSVVQYSNYIDKLSEFFMEIGRSTPRYQEMALLFPQSKKLQDCFTEYYIVVVHFCHRLLKMSKTSGLKLFLNSYKDNLSLFEKQLTPLADAIRDEMNIQSVVLAKEENKKSSHFRMLAKKDQEASEARRKEKQKLRLLDGCSTYDYQTTWKQTRKLGNTRLHENDENYKNWRASDRACTLVYSGRLGAGKSVLMANIVDELFIKPGPHYIAFFFCRYDVAESLRARTVLGCLVRQLLLAHGSLDQFDLVPLLDTASLSTEDLSQIILEICSKSEKPVYLVIDGLMDACDPKEREIALEVIKRCQTSKRLLLCISSRWEPDEQSKFRSNQLHSPTFSNIPEENPEVNAYIDSEIELLICSERLRISDKDLVPILKSAISQKSQGNFLWVSLLLDYICVLSSDYDILQALDGLPQAMSEIYLRLLDRHAATHKQYQETILQLISVAYRPLSIEELRETLSVEPGQTEWDTMRLSNNIIALLGCCSGVVVIDEEELSVSFVHESARQFLTERNSSHEYSFTITAAERTMAQIITTYLNFAVFDTQVSTVVVPEVSGAAVVNSVFATMPEHSRFFRSVSRLRRFSDTKGLDISRVLAETAAKAKPTTSSDLSLEKYARNYWFLHSAPVIDNDSMVKGFVNKLMGKGFPLRTPDISSPLSWAISNDYLTAFTILAEIGSSPGENLQGAIQIAAANGQRSIIEACLKSQELFSASDKEEDRFPWSLLLLAASKQPEALKISLNEMSVQDSIWMATKENHKSADKVQFYCFLLLQLVSRVWPVVLKSFSNHSSQRNQSWYDIYGKDQPFKDVMASMHRDLASGCLDHLLSTDSLLEQDICQLRDPGVLRKQIDNQRICRYLTSEIQYACCYWTRHMRESDCDHHLENRVLEFIKHRFFVWFEAVSLTGKALQVDAMLSDLWQLFSQSQNSELKSIIHDTRRFVLANEHLADLAPLQLYSSGVIFAPQKFKTRMNVVMPLWLKRAPGTQRDWSDWIQVLGGVPFDQFYSLAFSPDGKLLASSVHGKIKLWDISGQLLWTSEVYSGGELSFAFSPNGKLLACSDGGKIELRDISGQLLRTIEVPSGGMHSAFSPDGMILATGSRNKTIKLWDASTGKLLRTLVGHSYSVRSVTFSPDGMILASRAFDKTIKLWDVSTGKLLHTLPEHSYWVRSVTFSPDGMILASGSNDTTIELWGASTGRLQHTLRGHLDDVQSVAFSPDGMILASGSSDTTIKLWDASTGRLQHTLRGHLDDVQSVAFSPDGMILASGSGDRTIKLWDVSSEQLKRVRQSTEAESTDLAQLKGDFLKDEISASDSQLGGVLAFPSEQGTAQLTIGNDWLMKNGRRFLWLPREYRQLEWKIEEPS